MEISVGIFLVIFISFLVCILATPFIRNLAIKYGIIDHPNDCKVHSEPIAYLGGLAIYISSFSALFFLDKLNGQILAIFIGGTILVLIGLIDDVIGVLPNSKLLGEVIASLIVAKFAMVRVAFINQSYIAVPLALLWIIGLTNAFNLIDNMNGLSAGVAAITCFFLGLITLFNEQVNIAIVFFGLMACCLGFLRYNFHKAVIFMGDSGSLFLGFMISSLVIVASWHSRAPMSLAIPILVLSYPIFDTTLVTVARLIEKRRISDGGKDHSSHRLVKLGFSYTRSVVIIYILCFTMGIAALLIRKLPSTYDYIIIAVSSLFYISLGLFFIFKVKIKRNEKLPLIKNGHLKVG
ncbi:MAG: MraY family glycosyltransferase [bacterium]